ncbi:MAG TPA: glycoside hydrolase family 6 protein, partial [Trebonia sp.]
MPQTSVRHAWRSRHARALRVVAAAAITSISLAAGSFAAATSAGASTTAAATSTVAHGFGPGTRFFVPPPSSGAPKQILQLAGSGDLKDAALVAEMEAIPRAVWFTSGTPAQVQQQVQQTMTEAAVERAVPVLVAYDIPGRDCAQYSAGGALDQADYEAWINGFAQGIGNRKAIVIVEPDALGNMPSGCGLSSSVYPFTDSERIAELQYAVTALE